MLFRFVVLGINGSASLVPRIFGNHAIGSGEREGENTKDWSKGCVTRRKWDDT